MYYIFLDEIQKVKTIKNPYLDDGDDTVGFVDVLLGLMKKKNADVYVTGSNSRMLSSDILTEFRGRGDEVRVYPLTFAEFYASFEGDKHDAWQEYYTYGGMPYMSRLKDHRSKAQYLTDLFENIYLKDILERHNIQDKNVLDDLLDVISSAVGSLTNPSRIADTFASINRVKISPETIARYLDYFADAFMISHAKRYDIKGRKYIGSPQKYYYSDIGLRNARLNFRQTEENHIMENIIYNELIFRGFTVDVGVVEYNYKDTDGKSKKTNLEVDFIASDGNKKFYIQSALTVGEEEKRQAREEDKGLQVHRGVVPHHAQCNGLKRSAHVLRPHLHTLGRRARRRRNVHIREPQSGMLDEEERGIHRRGDPRDDVPPGGRVPEQGHLHRQHLCRRQHDRLAQFHVRKVTCGTSATYQTI